MTNSPFVALTCLLLALAAFGSIRVEAAGAAQGDLRAVALQKSDVPRGFGSPVVKLYHDFPGTMSLRISGVTRSCPLPPYYKRFGWGQGLYEVIPYGMGKLQPYDITVCASLFATASDAHVAFQTDLPVVRAELQLPASRRMRAAFISTPRIGNETIAWGVTTAGTKCYWLRFRQGDTTVQVSSPCGLVPTSTLVGWARLIDSRAR